MSTNMESSTDGNLGSEDLKRLAKRIGDNIKNPSFINLVKLGFEIEEAAEKARKTTQEENLEKAKKVLAAISAGRKLTQKEKNLIREIIIGDAERYIEEEENLEDKMEFLQRASKKLSEIAKDENPDYEQLAAILREVGSVLNSVAGYFEAKERVEKFNSAFPDLDDPSQKKILFEMMNSRLGINLF
ncbi:MAG: hypothetical protein QW728_01425 [Thermoplasmata archaeon]